MSDQHPGLVCRLDVGWTSVYLAFRILTCNMQAWGTRSDVLSEMTAHFRSGPKMRNSGRSGAVGPAILSICKDMQSHRAASNERTAGYSLI